MSLAQLSIKRRVVSDDYALPGVHPVLSRIYRGRGIVSEHELINGANALLHYQQLKGIDQAVQVLFAAIEQQHPIMIIGDFDADGATSTAICMLAMRAMGITNVAYLVPNRFDFGYGLSPEIVEVAHQQGAQTIITVDNGIACLAGVEKAKKLGLKVVVTDHHLPAETLPDADAIVNPNQPGCTFPSKNLAGCGVAFYVMVALKAHLKQCGWFTQHQVPEPNLASLLDIVALGTVADVVPLDHNNRILVHQGLQRIRAGKCRPGITAMIEVANRDAVRLKAQDLGFVVGPRLNAAGRLDDMSVGIECLLAEDVYRARMLAAELDSYNQQRRELEIDMKAEAEKVVAGITFGQQGLPAALTVFNEGFHQGLIGIVAGRIKEKYHRPTIAFALQDEHTLKGSARSVAGIHIRDILEQINTQYPGLIIKFGGHAMAAGLSIDKAKLSEFDQAFIRACQKYEDTVLATHELLTDGMLDSQYTNLEFAQELANAGPFGQAFAPPLFDGEFTLVSQRLLKDQHLKMVCQLDDGQHVDAIAFNVDTNVWPNPRCQRVTLVYRPEINEFRGNQSLQFMVEALLPQ